MTNDAVNHPKHYTSDESGIECIHRHTGGLEIPNIGFCKRSRIHRHTGGLEKYRPAKSSALLTGTNTPSYTISNTGAWHRE